MDNVFSQPIDPPKSNTRDTKTLVDTVYGKQVFEADKEVPPAGYLAILGKPYAMEALGVNMTYAKASPTAMNDLKAIDGYVLEQMAKNGLDNTKEAYQEMLDRIYDLLDIGKNTATPVKIQKFAQLINAKGLKPVKIR